MDDKFETFIDEDALIPWYLTRRTREGGSKKDDEVTFHQSKGLAVSNAVKKIPENTQDILSVFYYARTLDVTGVKPNEYFPLSLSSWMTPFMFQKSYSLAGNRLRPNLEQ